MKILSVRIYNILSIENAEVSFEDNGLVLVEGWNYDDGRATGAGKTAIFNALCFGIYGKLPRKITASEVLRNGTKKGFVMVDIQVGNRIIAVRRERPNKLMFEENGVQLDIGQEEFESIIKLSYDQFLMSMYAAQGGQNRLIGKNDTEKKDFLLQLMNLNEFAACKKEAQRIIDEWTKEIESLENKKTIIKTQIDVHETVSCDVNLNMKYIATLNEKIDSRNQGIVQLQTIPKPDMSKYIKLESDIRDKQKQFAETRAKKSMLHQQYKQLSLQDVPFASPKPDAECPHCAGELNIRGKSIVKADDKAALKKQHDDHVAEIRVDLLALKKQIDDCDAFLLNENKIVLLQDQLIKKKSDEYSDYDKASKKISELRLLINSDQGQINSLQNEINSTLEWEKKVDVLKKSIVKIDSDIKKKAFDLELLQTVCGIYSPTGAQAYVIDYIVDSFNDAITEFVDLIWPNASYKLNAFKEKKDGDVVAKFSETLIINGKEKSIGMLSGGEFRAISLVMDFAVISMLSKQFGMPLNPVILDEPFEGLDSVGREIVIGLLEKLSQDRQIWVIDHMNESKVLFKSVVRVEKRNDVTTITRDNTI